MSKKIKIISINTEESWPQFITGMGMLFLMFYGAMALFIPPINTFVKHNHHLFSNLF